MSATSSIHQFLKEAHVRYAVLPHGAAFTAEREAAAAHVPQRDWAKVVSCFVDGEPVEAVVPASKIVNLERLLELTGGTEIRLAREDEMVRVYPGCELGAMPPLGPLYGQPVFVDVSLAGEPDIFFNAGTHTEAIRMRWTDFVGTVRPIVGSFADPADSFDDDFSAAFRE